MKLLLSLCFTLFTYSSYSQSKPMDEVKAALDKQVQAWNSGDLEHAMAFYWNSPQLTWISRAGIEKGYQPVYDSYLKDFTDRSTMGKFTYEPLHIEALSAKVVYYAYSWKIELNGKKLMGGVSSQIWKKAKKRWVITSEHAS